MDTTIIKMVINTLNTIEVKGKDNMSAMLGSIQALENFVQMAAQAPMGEQKENGNG